MNQPIRKFTATTAAVTEVPLLIGLIGPPGGGKTYSALRLAAGMQAVRSGPVVLVDTERGRARKYAAEHKFLHVDFPPPFVPEDFLEAVKQQITEHKPAAIIIDSLSDEHEGEGGVLDWHDRDVDRVGGNQWAAWAKPKASRRRMIAGFLQITTPIIMTFRAREKTRVEVIGGKNVPVNIGYQPIAPAEVIYALDVTCILPPRANGVPQWRSEKLGEDFIIKLPKFLAHCFTERGQLDENTGTALARWAKGEAHSAVVPKTAAAPAPIEPAQPKPATGAVADDGGISLARSLLRGAATRGMKDLEEAWLRQITKADRQALQKELPALKAAATAADQARIPKAPDAPVQPVE